MLEQRQLVFTVIFAALVASVGIDAVVSFLVLAKMPGDPPADRTVLYALGGLAAALAAVVIPVVRGRLMPPTEPARSIADPVLAPSAYGTRKALRRLFTAHIVTWALSEAIALFGLVTVLLYHDTRYFLGFATVAVVSFVLNRPSLALTQSVVRAAKE